MTGAMLNGTMCSGAYTSKTLSRAGVDHICNQDENVVEHQQHHFQHHQFYKAASPYCSTQKARHFFQKNIPGIKIDTRQSRGAFQIFYKLSS
jgi:hypothetical protein